MKSVNGIFVHRLPVLSSSRAGAFTLVELMVAIGLLALMMGLAGSIFALTLESSGEANALIEVKQSIRAFEYTLREDLKNVDSRESMMIIQGNIICAHLTQDDMEFDDDNNPLTGSPLVKDPERELILSDDSVILEMPRADMLMFFTNRPGESYTDHRVKGRKQQVVYGHAEVGKLTQTGTWVDGVPPRDVTSVDGDKIYAYVTSQFDPRDALDPENIPSDVPTYPIPARQWHLARRGVLLVDQDFSSTYYSSGDPYYPVTDLDDVDEPDAWDPQYPSILKKKYWIVDGRRDFLANEMGSFSFGYDVAFNLPGSVAPPIPAGPHADVEAVQNDLANPQGLKIPWFARSQMDTRPLPQVAGRLGHYMLPHCAGFKVEWRLSPEAADVPDKLRACERDMGDLIWVDPADIKKAYNEVNDCAGPNLPLLLQTLDPENSGSRFHQDTVGSNHIFYSKIQQTNGVEISDPFFPTALRITMDVYDAAGRLERPIRHVMVLPVGEE